MTHVQHPLDGPGCLSTIVSVTAVLGTYSLPKACAKTLLLFAVNGIGQGLCEALLKMGYKGYKKKAFGQEVRLLA